jgi:hypothetical protein
MTTFGGCYGTKNPNVKLSDVLHYSNSNITKIIFKDGTGKNRPFTLANRQDIDNFLNNYINGIVVQKKSTQTQSSGYIRSIVLYENDKVSFVITLANGITIENVYYDVIKGEISTSQLDKFIQSVNPGWINYS